VGQQQGMSENVACPEVKFWRQKKNKNANFRNNKNLRIFMELKKY
jgi:hypothetical protein